jgi:hypothetical protein
VAVVDEVDDATTVITSDAEPVANPRGNACPTATTGPDEWLAAARDDDVGADTGRAADPLDRVGVALGDADADARPVRAAVDERLPANSRPLVAGGCAGTVSDATPLGSSVVGDAVGQLARAMPPTNTAARATAATAAEVDRTGANRMWPVCQMVLM